MHRVLKVEKPIPDVLETLELARKRYNNLQDFPFSEIVKDIQDFTHRKKKNK